MASTAATATSLEMERTTHRSPTSLSAFWIRLISRWMPSPTVPAGWSSEEATMPMKVWCGTVVVVFLSAASLSAAENPLVDAVKSGNRQAIRALLKKPTDVNAVAADGSTALHWAIRADDLETVNLLLRAGADVNI